jgi:hypothetical protein
MLFASLSLLPGPQVFAQAAVDPTGHWEGSVKLPAQDLRIAVDIFRNAKGELQATFGEPDRGVKGLPFTTVGVTGRSVRLVLKTAEAVSSFVGEISTDGKTLSGDASQGGEAAPFQLAHKGEPQIAPAPKNAAVAKELEGTWNGALELGDRRMRIVLKLQNQPDGTASGTVMSPDGSGIEIPISVAQKGANVSLEASSVGASFAGLLNGAELHGTWTQQGQTLPLVFRRAEK